MGIIFSILVLLGLGLSIAWSAMGRKLVKSRIRGICVIASFLIALIGALAFQGTITDPAFINDTLMPMIASYIPAEAQALLDASPTLYEVAFGMVSALVTPLLFVVLYILVSILGWIVYGIILLVRRSKAKNSKSKGSTEEVPYAMARTIAWGVVQALLVLVVIFVPVSVYGRLAVDVTDTAIDAKVLGGYEAQVEQLTAEYVKPVVESPFVEIFRVFGGDLLTDEMTSFTVKGTETNLNNEIGALVHIAGKALPLTKTEPASFGKKEADIIVEVADLFAKSKILPAIGSEVAYDATDAWIKGEEFAGVSADTLHFGDGMFDSFIDRTISILHTDSKKTTTFCADVKTLAKVAGAMIEGGVVANIKDTDALTETLAEGDTIQKMILALGQNSSMKALIPEVTNIGIEAITDAVEVKEDANTAYNELLAAVAAALNNAKNTDAEEAQVSALSAELLDAFDHAGIAIGKKDIDLYSEAMLQEIVAKKGNAAVTAADVQSFFANTKAVDPAGMQSAEAYAEATLLIFRDELMLDVDKAAAKITDKNAEQEANAIGSIFAQAGSLLEDVSGEINIGDMAESVGGILNAFNSSVCVGPERTSKLFIAIVQSGMVRDAANMDIATATEIGTRGSTGDNVDYAKTFKTISHTMELLENMNSSTEGGMSQEDLTTVLKDLNQQTAGMIESYITEERLSQDYGLNEEQSGTAAPLISDVFGYMGSADMTEEECEKEAEAINDVMNLVTSASDKANNTEAPAQSVFGGEDSVIGKDAAGTVETFMASESIKHSLNNNSDKLEEDAFGMQNMLVQDGEKDEKKELEDAMKNYYETTEYETEEDKANDKETLTNLGKLFGFTNDEMKYILGE